MANDYTGLTFVNGVTKGNAANFNTLNDGIDVNSMRTSYGNTIGGTANAITVTTNTGNWSFAIGEPIKGIATANNTGAVTCQVDGGTVYTVKRLDGSSYIACKADDFEDNKPFELIGQNDGTDFLLLAPRGGACIKSIQRGISTVTGTGITVAISSVDPNSSIIKITLDPKNTSAHVAAIKAQIDNATQVSFSRNTNGGTAPVVSWEVIEFNNVKSKQSGNASFTSSTSVTISTVDTAKTAIFVSNESNLNSTSLGIYGSHVLAELTSSTNINLTGTSGVSYIVNWQALEFK